MARRTLALRRATRPRVVVVPGCWVVCYVCVDAWDEGAGGGRKEGRTGEMAFEGVDTVVAEEDISGNDDLISCASNASLGAFQLDPESGS